MPEANTYDDREWGRPGETPTAPDPQGQPRGEARFVVPHAATFTGSQNLSARTYWTDYDEATRHSIHNAFTMRLDPVIDACLRLRTYPTALLTAHADPEDDTDPRQVECAALTERVTANMPGFLFAKRWLLDDGIFKGKSGVQTRYQWVSKRGRLWQVPTGFVPIDGDKLIFKMDPAVGSRVGILVSSAFAGRAESCEKGRVYFPTVEEREQLIVHEYEPEDRGFYDSRLAGAIHGTGLRGRLYWLWALKSRVWAMGMDFLEWFARGITLFYFESGNDAHFQEVKAWVEGQMGSSAMFFPRLRNGEPGYKPVERLEVNTASPQFIMKLLTEYFDDLFKLVILGQTLTSGTAPTGLGSGVSQAHQSTFENFVKYDAVALGETITRDLMTPFYRANFPGVPPASWVLEVDDPNVQQLVENAQVLYQMGAAVPEGPLLEASGLPEVKDGDTILTNVQPMQPAAVGPMPDGTPVLTGPDGEPGRQSGPPLRMSLREWATVVTAARKGNRRAQKLFRTRRVVVPGLSVANTNRWWSRAG